ncbi:hypothetical protein [Aeromicrobium halocynthiae]
MSLSNRRTRLFVLSTTVSMLVVCLVATPSSVSGSGARTWSAATGVGHERRSGSGVVAIDGGVVVEQGPPEKVIADPSAERTRRFLERILNIG